MRASKYPTIGREEFLSRLEPFLTPRDIEMIATAYVFSKYGHRGQRRKGKFHGRSVRYFEHPKAVALIIIDELKIYDWRLIVAALLHDIKEDSFILTWHRLYLNFGKNTVLRLKLLTKDPRDGYLERLMSFGDWFTLLVKLCDRLHNLRTLSGGSEDFQKKQILETREQYLPLADLLVSKLPKKYRSCGEYLKHNIQKICDDYAGKLAL